MPAPLAKPRRAPFWADLDLTDYKGIAYLIAGVFIFSFQDIIVKVLSDRFPVHQLVFMRSLIALPLLFLVVHYESGLGALGTKRPFMHALRSFIMFGAFLFYYLALPLMPLTTVVALWFTSPLFITAFAVPILGERIGWRRLAGILIGFAGALVIIRPGLDTFQPAAVLAIVAAICYAFAQVLGRKIGITESASVMSFYVALTFLYMGGALGLGLAQYDFANANAPAWQFLFRDWAMPKGIEILLIAIIGVIAAVGFFLLSQAYRVSKAAVVAPFEYTAMLWVSIFSFVLWGELPGRYTLIGTAMIIIGGVYVLHREQQRREKPLAGRGVWRARN